MQYFKGDALEKKFYESARQLFDDLSSQKDLFDAGAYETAPLGDMIWEPGLSPLSNAISKSIFRLAFSELVEAFVDCGSFEAYLTVFRKIFGDDVTVTFTVPAPGKLVIDIEAEGVELTDFVARLIEDNAYVFDEVIDYDDDIIAFQTIKGFQSQYELEQMLREMVPGGVWTDISLTLGGS